MGAGWQQTLVFSFGVIKNTLGVIQNTLGVLLNKEGVLTNTGRMSQGDRHGVRLGVADNGKAQARQTDKLSDACAIFFGLAKNVITTLAIV